MDSIKKDFLKKSIFLFIFFIFMLLTAAQKVGAGLSTVGLAGAGVGIEAIFGALILEEYQKTQA